MGALQAFAPLSIDMYLPAMPVMEKVFHTSSAAVQLTLVTFLLGYALGQPLYGPITDRFGRKPPLYVSLLLFIGSSAACAISPSIYVMSFFRLLQAVGACGGAVMSRAMVSDLFPASELRRIFSMLVLVLGVSPVVAPLIGSYLLVWFDWRAAFIVQASMGVLCLVGMHFRLPESLAHDARRPLHLDVIHSTYARLIKDRTFLGASVVCGFSSSGTFAYIASAPFVFITLYKVPTERFGWLFGSVAIGMVVAAQINGRMSHKIALWRVLRTANLVQLVAGLLLLASVVTGVGGMYGVYAGVFVYVSAQGFVFPNGSAIAMMRHGDIAGTASALLGTNQFLIAAIMTTFLGFIDNPALPMALVIAGSAIASTSLNFLTLGRKLETAPVPALNISRLLIAASSLILVSLQAAELKPETAAAFDRYIKVTEEEMNQHVGFGDFLWMDRHPDKKSVVWLGQSTIVPLTTLDHGQEIEVPDGMIQHWLGLAYLEKATLDKTSTILQNFNEYHNMIPLQIMDSKTVKHEGDNSEAFLRLFKKQVSAVVLNVNETATYKMLDASRAVIACRSTHIGEAEHPKNKKKLDEERDADDSAGYLWRMNTYLRMEQADNGVYVEIEMVTLARQTGGLINTSRFLTGFQSFPHELTQGFIAALEYIYPNKR